VCFPGNIFQASLIVASNVVAYRVEKLMVLQSKGRLIAFPTNVRLKTRPVPKSVTLVRLAMDKRSSLL
jgi:hypothetical protein